MINLHTPFTYVHKIPTFIRNLPNNTLELITKIKNIILRILDKIENFDFPNYFYSILKIEDRKPLWERKFESTQRKLENDLNNWVKAGCSNKDEDRKIAKEKILSSYNAQSLTLDLSGLRLTSLPPSIKLLTQVISLNLNDNRFTILPSEVVNLNHLAHLHVADNQLASLPQEIGNLINLKILSLSGNQLTVLPQGINKLINLTHLSLGSNQLTVLPPGMGNLKQLKVLGLDFNRKLNELPLSLGQIPTLLNIEYISTELTRGHVEAILELCKELRKEESTSILPTHLKIWFNATTIKLNISPFEELDYSKKAILHEWLSRLELASDFTHNQRKLATLACQMMNTLIDPEFINFKELFFVQADANNENCGDRAAMAFNEAHTTWILVTQLADAPPKERLNLMLACARTIALRIAIGKAMKKQSAPDGENSETYLYYETLLRKRLELVSPIETTLQHAETIGKRDWIKKEELVKEVYETYMDELMKFPIFDKFTNEEPTFKAKWDTCKSEYAVKVENLSNQTPDAPFESEEYLNWQHAMGELMQQRTKAFQKIVEEFMNTPHTTEI